jgi:hypothetical protein
MKDVLLGALDQGAAAVRGGVKAALGAPGDIRNAAVSLADATAQRQPQMAVNPIVAALRALGPTQYDSQGMGQMLPPMTRASTYEPTIDPREALQTTEDYVGPAMIPPMLRAQTIAGQAVTRAGEGAVPKLRALDNAIMGRGAPVAAARESEYSANVALADRAGGAQRWRETMGMPRLPGESDAEYLARKAAADPNGLVAKLARMSSPTSFARQPVNEDDLLVGLHNLSDDNLRHADRMGGLPVPSLAISKVSSPLDGFGDVSLIAPQSLVTPGRGNPVFAADAYSPRYPSVNVKLDREALRILNARLKPFGDGEIYSGSIDKVDDLISDPRFRAMSEADGATGYHDRKAIAEQLLRDVGAQERIFKGYTDSGNRRYAPHTIEEVTKFLKSKGARAGEGFNYGTNSLRAQVTPQLRNMSQIKASRDRIQPLPDVEAAKEANTAKLFELAEQFRPYSPAPDSFGFYDALTENLGDWARGRVRLEEFYPGITPEVKDSARQFMSQLRESPVGYFEAKPQRAVRLDEFAGAMLPQNAPDDLVQLLAKHGITDLQRYSSPAEKAAAAKKFKQHLFQVGVPVGAGGLALGAEDEPR